MPYPILTLPYPFAKRLRKLLNPFELKELQQAAGTFVPSGLKPILVHCQADFITFEKRYNPDNPANSEDLISVYRYDTIIRLSEKHQNFIKWCDTMEFWEMNYSDLANFDYNKLLINVDDVSFKNCHISNVFLEAVSKMVLRPRCLDTRGSHHFDEDVKFSTIHKYFPIVHTIALTTSYFGWLDDINSTGKQFHIVEIHHSNFENIFSFRPEELYDFVTKQYPKFYLHLCIITDDIAATVDKITPYIDPRFDFKFNGDPKLDICVKLPHTSEGKYVAFYFYKNV